MEYRHDRHRNPICPGTRVVIPRIPLLRLIQVELRKMFNTHSGFRLLASIVIATVLATVAVIVFAADAELTYSTYMQVIQLPIAVILPIIAILPITSEWSQRTGLTAFTSCRTAAGSSRRGDLVGHRRRARRAAGPGDRSARQPGRRRGHRHRPGV
jgi:hypothetical protein